MLLLRSAVLALALCTAGWSAPIQLFVEYFATNNTVTHVDATAGASQFDFGPITAGPLSGSGELTASIATNEISLQFTNTSFVCPGDCGGDFYGLHARLLLSAGLLPTGPLNFSASATGTADLGFPIITIFDAQVNVNSGVEDLSSQYFLDSGSFSLAQSHSGFLLPAYGPQERAAIDLWFEGAPATYFEGNTNFSNLNLTLTQATPEPGTAALLVAAGLFGVAGVGLRRRRYRAE